MSQDPSSNPDQYGGRGSFVVITQRLDDLKELVSDLKRDVRERLEMRDAAMTQILAQRTEFWNQKFLAAASERNALRVEVTTLRAEVDKLKEANTRLWTALGILGVVGVPLINAAVQLVVRGVGGG